MVQREVARRICAAPGTADYGAFSVCCQYHTRPELLFDVPPECFLPAPKVTSSVIQLVPHIRPPVDADPKALFPVVPPAFPQRRKTPPHALSATYRAPFPTAQPPHTLSHPASAHPAPR